MQRLRSLLLAAGVASLLLPLMQCTSRQPEQAGKTAAAAEARTGSPADQLPAYITRMTYFGQRADWPLNGKDIRFLKAWLFTNSQKLLRRRNKAIGHRPLKQELIRRARWV